MEQLEFLEQELKMLQENISRVKECQKQYTEAKYTPWNTRVVGELKHRIVALKQRMTIVSKMTTRDLF